MREEVDWQEAARASLLLKAVRCWRKNSDSWFAHAYERLPETVRVNPLSGDQEWIENWLKSLGCKPIEWFNGVGSAWTMPFPRGKAEGEVKSTLAALHETGRLTRQEAVSMLPVLALEPKPGEYILDLCASPGSKTSQIAEHLNNSGVVVANEVVRGRVNLLVSNMQRHRSRSNIIVNHDARHFPKVPEFGYDRILVDAPCTGTGTTRKNPDVWSRWKPNGGRSMQKLQIDILDRATKLVKPDGRVVYSTCSLDPVENEAVVAEVLRKDPSLRLISAHDLIPDLVASKGMKKWSLLSDECSIVQDNQVQASFLPPSETEIIDALPLCMRVWNDESKAGGFFLAVIEKQSSQGEEGSVRVHRELTQEEAPLDNEDIPQPISSETRTILEKRLGHLPSDLWIRGKKVLWSTPQAHEIWSSERSRRGGRTRIPGRRWRPLKVVYLGLEAIHLRRGEFERIVGSAAKVIADGIKQGLIEVPSKVIDSLLSGDEPDPSLVSPKLSSVRGNFLLVDEANGNTIPVWIGGRVSLMMRTAELYVLRRMRAIAVEEEE